MTKCAVLFSLFTLSSTAVLADSSAAVPEGAIPIENRSEIEREFPRNSNSEEALSDLNQQVPSKRSQSIAPAPRAFVQGEAPSRNSEAIPIERGSVIPNPNTK